MKNNLSTIFFVIASTGITCAQTNEFPPDGNVGIGTTSPAAKISFNNLDDGTNGPDGITWYNPYPLDYGIFRTTGSWLSPDYQQLRINFLTGIVLNPGSAYGKSFVDIQGGGLRVSTGNVGIGTTAPSFKIHIKGSNLNSDRMSLGSTTTGNFALTSADGGAYGLFAGISNTGRAWMQAGRFDTNISYDLTVQAAGGNFGIGVTNPRFKLDVAGQIATNFSFLENPIDPDNNYTRTNFGSNVYWDAAANRWQVSPIGNNDFSSIIHPNSDGLAFVTAPTTANAPRTFTHAEFMAYERMRITAGGNVLIGKTSQQNANYKLDVNGAIRSNEVVVNATGADFVFDDNYKLRSLKELEQYIHQNRHLPGVHSANEIQQNGLEVGKMEMVLLQKVEELTLYLIELKKEVDTLQKENIALKRKTSTGSSN